jgi:enoyl-CoA hydratase/carnithine racemase
VIILRGAGRGFCAGLDLGQNFMVDDNSKMYGNQYRYRLQQIFSDIVLNMRRAQQPIIGAIRGPSVGAGFSLALACDIRIAGESARFNAAFIRVGFSAGDMGISYFLPRMIGISRASEYLYTGRFLDASTAEKIGLVSKVVKDDQVDEAGLELAKEIIQNSPLGIRLTKEVLNFNIDAPSLESALQLENRTQVLCGSTEDHKEGAQAFLEKRKPVYHDR